MSAINSRATLSYSASHLFLASGTWQQVHASFLQQLPIRNIHWKAGPHAPIATVQELDINFVPLESVKDENTSQIPSSVLDRPLLHIYVFACEDNDLETYRNTIKKQIKDWHAIVSTRKNQEWLILQVVKSDVRVAGGNFFQLKGTVMVKVKADFNVDKRDRCVQLPWTVGHENPTAWAETISRIKDLILHAFGSAISQREEEVKRSESQRQMPGWNFCTFFILKESLAASFEGVTLFEEALAQYDQLERSFYGVLRDRNLSWFGTLISPSSTDDSAPLLSISKKPYRDLIIANTISIFDFRIYLLARQCELLAKMGRLHEISRKAGAFLGAFGRRLRQVEDTLPPYFVESWTHASALSVVEQCDAWATPAMIAGSRLLSFNAGKAELLELARTQLDIIGVKVGHLPMRSPFSSAFESELVSDEIDTLPGQRSTKRISNRDIVLSIDNRETFYDTYITTTNLAIDMYAQAGRRKFALKLHGSLAALDVHRGRLSTALSTYTSLPAHYSHHKWSSLESFMLHRALETHADMGNPRDSDWIRMALGFLKTCVDTSCAGLVVEADDEREYISSIVAALRTAVDALDADITSLDHPFLSIKLSQRARNACDRDGTYIDTVLTNHIPCTISLDSVTVLLAGHDSQHLRLSVAQDGPLLLEPGRTSLTLFCSTPCSGTYVLDTSEARLSHILFQWQHRKPSTKGMKQKPSQGISLVEIPHDSLAVDVQLQQPEEMHLGRMYASAVSVSSGRNHITSGKLKLQCPLFRFRLQDSTLLDEDGDITFNPTEDYIELSNISPGKTITITVPHADASTWKSAKIDIAYTYTSTVDSITRTLELSQTIDTSLPISFFVEDFFRGPRLFTKFTVSTTRNQCARILEAYLKPSDECAGDVTVKGCSPRRRRVITITPSQPASLLFCIDSPNGPVRDPMTLHIRFCVLQEEIEWLIHECVKSAVGDANLRSAVAAQLVATVSTDSSWTERYLATGQVRLPSTGDKDVERVLQLLERRESTWPPNGPWRNIRIPVDIPRIDIVATTSLQVLTPVLEWETLSDTVQPPNLYAGQPISALLSVETSFHWGPGATKDHVCVLRFDIEEMVKEWLVSGRKRGDFVAIDGGVYTVPITLVALHHGKLSLPKVGITALPLASSETTMGSKSVPNTVSYQVRGAETVLVLPRGGRSTFFLGQ